MKSIAWLSFVLSCFIAAPAPAATWSISIPGNTYRCEPEGTPSIRFIGDAVTLNAGDRCCVFFRVDRPAEIKVGAIASAADTAVLVASFGDRSWQSKLPGTTPRPIDIGIIRAEQAGYIRIDLEAEGGAVRVSELTIDSDTESLTLDYIKSNEGNMYYWGRRGPSVHLAYSLPPAVDIQYAYSEITVPEGEDHIGSYFMANGFSEGYFGIQVNSPLERRVLFSVWSPFRTDNPQEIPEDQRVVKLAAGQNVQAQDFGNEGSGGQSFMIYPWKAGVTYRFLTEVRPDGQGNTIYTSWFAEKAADKWQLIASFRRPKTDKYLTGFHSFLENFVPDYGHLSRKALYGNQWVRSVQGQWFEITEARFSGDATARGRHRMDYAGGVETDNFFLEHCGFFAEPFEIGRTLKRSTSNTPPQINFENLPNG